MLLQMRLDSDSALECIVARTISTVRIDWCRLDSGDKGDWSKKGRWAEQTVRQWIDQYLINHQVEKSSKSA